MLARAIQIFHANRRIGGCYGSWEDVEVKFSLWWLTEQAKSLVVSISSKVVSVVTVLWCLWSFSGHCHIGMEG